MPPVAAIAAAVLPAIGAAAAGAAGLAAGAASVVGSVASGILGAGAGLAGGAASAIGEVAAIPLGFLFPSAAPVTVAQQMAAIAEPAYYGAGALGVPAATGGIGSGLSTILTGVQAGVGIYGQLAELEIAEGISETEKIAAQTKLIEAEALKIYAAAPTPPPVTRAAPLKALPTLPTQPIYVTPAPAAAAPNYLLYAGLAFLAYILLKGK